MSKDEESAQMVRELLQGAIPVNPASPDYISRMEFTAKMSEVESKIENAVLRQKQWVLTGCIVTLLAFGSGYVSLVSKIDRLTEQLPILATVQTARGSWIQRQDRRDQMQDETLRKLDKDYTPMPYQEPPQ